MHRNNCYIGNLWSNIMQRTPHGSTEANLYFDQLFYALKNPYMFSLFWTKLNGCFIPSPYPSVLKGFLICCLAVQIAQEYTWRSDYKLPGPTVFSDPSSSGKTMQASVEGSKEPEEPNLISFESVVQTAVLVSVKPVRDLVVSYYN